MGRAAAEASGALRRAAAPIDASGACGLYGFLVALPMIQTPDQRTIQPTIQLVVGYYVQTQAAWNCVAAATPIACVPVIIPFLLLQRALIAGPTAGAVNG